MHHSYFEEENLNQTNKYKKDQIFKITKTKCKRKWTNADDSKLILLASNYNEKHWKQVAYNFENKNPLQCLSRYKRIKPGIKKGQWCYEEDTLILDLVSKLGKSWSKIAKILKTRNGKQVRDRYINVLDPNILKQKFSEEEDKYLIELYFKLGPKWAEISKYFKYRTPDMIKNRFHSSIKRVISKHFNLNLKTVKFIFFNIFRTK